ncbi:MAG: extracellular solute-binding protein [Clostridiales bacterium]|jgi:ABC-type glycerol-3-phosphate transport system substrate-binding protein|nr:extracellular solute-binding protein [Clostridiales bacterium]
MKIAFPFFILKNAAALTLAAAMTVGLSACAAGGGTEQSGGAAAAVSEEKVTLQYMTLSDGVLFDAETRIFKGVTDKYPNIVVETTSVPGVDTFITALKAKFAAGEEPDMYSFQAGTRIREFAKEGLLKDITDEPYMDRVNDADKAFNSWQGRIYGIPAKIEYAGLFVNNEVLAKYPDVKAPTNFEEFKAACEQLRAQGFEYPALLAGKDINNVSQINFQYLATIAVPQNPDYYQELIDGTRRFSDQWVEELFGKYGEVLEYVAEDRLGVDNDEAIKRFIRGEGVFWFAHGSTIQRIREMAGEEFDFSLYPTTLQNADETRYFLCAQALALAVVESSKHPEEVRAAVTEFLSPEACDIIARDGKAMPAMKNSNVLPDKSLEPCREWFDSGVKVPHADLVWVPGIKDIMKQVTQKWIMGDDLQSCLDEWESQHRRLLEANPDFVTNYGKE